VTEWNAPSSPTLTTLAVDPPAINLGDTVQLTATAVPASATPGVPTGSVTFITGRTILGTAPLTDCGGVAKAILSVTRPLLPAGTTSVTATYSGDSAFDGSTGSATVSVAAQSAGSAVVVSITPNPAHEGQVVKVTLTEVNGVGTRITGWTINGADDFPRFIPDFGTDMLPPQGTLSSTIITAAGVPFPSNRVYVFSGVDADGRTWSQQLTLTLVGSATPAMALTGVPASNPSCGWTQGLVLKELDGLSVQLTRLLVAGTDRSAEIAQLFGSSMLAPMGTLEAQICWPAAPPNVVYEVAGIDQTGSPVKASFNTSPPAQ